MIIPDEKVTNVNTVNAIWRSKKNNFELRSVKLHEVEHYTENENWSLARLKNGKLRKTKTRQYLKKDFSLDIQFENKIWCLFYKLGFHVLNQDRRFFVNEGSTSHQIDVYAEDEETIFIVECKATKVKNNTSSLRKDIIRLQRIKELEEKISKEKNNKAVKFIFATNKNYFLGKADKELLKNSKIEHWSENVEVSYYDDLGIGYGAAGKHQMQSLLLKNSKIKNLKTNFPAISCKMGDLNYYNLSIDPMTLLKICTVPHRHTAERDTNPSYQRMVKSSRLKKVREFIASGGNFPNSIIISINRTHHFKKESKSGLHLNREIGILSLPKEYGSCTVVDGQHRLYGYADNPKRAKTDAIPVIAFDRLDDVAQMKMFTDINTNQKNVSPDTMIAIEEDLHKNSDNIHLRFKSYYTTVTKLLNEEEDSPLKGAIKIGENKRESDDAKITIRSIRQSLLQKTKFFGRANNNGEIIEAGIFNFGEDRSSKMITSTKDFIKKSLTYIKENLKDDWMQGHSGYLLTPDGISALIVIFSEVAEYVAKSGLGKHTIPCSDIDKLFAASKPYYDSITKGFSDADESEKEILKRTYGGGGFKIFWRTLQSFINSEFKDYQPEGLSEYLQEKPRFSAGTHDLVLAIEDMIKEHLKKLFQKYHGNNWEASAIPKDVRKSAREEAAKKDDEKGVFNEHHFYEHGLYFSDLGKIIKHNTDLRKHKNIVVTDGMKALKEIINTDFDIPKQPDKFTYLEDILKIRNKTSHESALRNKLILMPKQIQLVSDVHDHFVDLIQKYNY